MEYHEMSMEIDGTYWSIVHLSASLLAQPQAKHAGWQALEQASPSGKLMFECETCGRISVTPDKRCPIGKTIDLAKYLIVKEIE